MVHDTTNKFPVSSISLSTDMSRGKITPKGGPQPTTQILNSLGLKGLRICRVHFIFL